MFTRDTCKGEPNLSTCIQCAELEATQDDHCQPEADVVTSAGISTLCGAPEAVWIRQVVLRALSPLVYARLVTEGHLFPATQSSNVNAILRCSPAPVPTKLIESLNEFVEAQHGFRRRGNYQMPMAPALCFALGRRASMLSAAVATGSDPYTLVSATAYKCGSGIVCAEDQPCTVSQATTIMDDRSLLDAINEGLALRSRLKTHSLA
eukprot:SAG11_NODE_682_length_7769_cov_45.167275_3_plen_207_part_00